MLATTAPIFVVAVLLAPPSDLERLQGTWLLTASKLGAELQEIAEILADGQDNADAPEERHLMTFKGDRCRITLFQGDRECILGDDIRVELDPDASPKQVTLRYSDNVMVARGIYTFKDDDLIICDYIGHEDDRPPSFDKLRGNDLLSTYKRADPD